MYIMVSIQKMNACIKLENQSKYKLRTAGTPTERNGIEPSRSPTNPGRRPNNARFAVANAAYTNVLITEPEIMFPK